jgi:hypothetical protein
MRRLAATLVPLISCTWVNQLCQLEDDASPQIQMFVTHFPKASTK